MVPITESDETSSVGFEKLIHHEAGPILPKGGREVSEKLNNIPREKWPQTLQNITEQAVASIKKEEIFFDQRQSLFTCVLTADGQITGLVNPIAKPFVFAFENSNPPIPGSQSYLEAEKLADGSSWYGLIAATISDTPSRQRMAELFSSTLLKLVTTEETPNLALKISDVFWNKNTPVAYVIVNTHGKNDVFGGVNADPNKAKSLLLIHDPQEMQNQLENLFEEFTESNATNQNLLKWAQDWQERSKGLTSEIEDGEKLNLNQIKFVELLSHLYNSERVISLLAENIDPSRSEDLEKQENSTTWESIKSRLLKLDSRCARIVLDNFDDDARRHQKDVQEGLLNPDYKDSGIVIAINPHDVGNKYNPEFIEVARCLRQNEKADLPELKWVTPPPLRLRDYDIFAALQPESELSLATIDNALPGIEVQILKMRQPEDHENRSEKRFWTGLHIIIKGSVYYQILASPKPL
jgi:hypothetical protein